MSDKDKTNTEEEISIWDNKGFLFIVILTVFLMPMAFGIAWLVQNFHKLH